VLNLLTAPRAARTVRGLLGTVADAVRSVIAPAALVADQAQQKQTAAPDPSDIYAPEEMPETGVIEAAAAEYERAAEQARRADRSKCAARQVLDRLRATRVARLHRLCGADYADGTANRREGQDDAEVRARAAEAAASR
jgi:hypothetical protein